MTAASSLFEKIVASSINRIPDVQAERPKASVSYSDVRVLSGNTQAWIEVKMSHHDNFANPRVFYANGMWRSTNKTPAAQCLTDELNKSDRAKTFIDVISMYSNIPHDQIYIPTTRTGVREPNAVPLETMRQFFAENAAFKYILHVDDYPLDQLITDHYTAGKKEPAHYLQAGDDFYMISNTNPLMLPSDIPLISGRGSLRARISVRSKFYEVQGEIKLHSLPKSKYSVLEIENKRNPFHDRQAANSSGYTTQAY